VGKAAGEKYTLFLGGNVQGTRMAFHYKDFVLREDLIPTLVPVLTHYKAERQEGESFGDFCFRQGPEALAAYAESVPVGATEDAA
jgi:sulfite reductase (ferredoxin)